MITTEGRGGLGRGMVGRGLVYVRLENTLRDVSDLSERDMRILAFERRGWRSAGVKEQAITEVFDMPPTRYYQLLNDLIDRPEALAFDPVLVKRLRAQRARRQRMRSPR